MNHILIVVRGCDDETRVIVHYSEEQMSFFESFCKSIALASDGGCQPDISYYTIPDEAYQTHLKWQSLNERCEDFLGGNFSNEEMEFYSNYYGEYWLESQAIEPKFNAYKFREQCKF